MLRFNSHQKALHLRFWAAIQALGMMGLASIIVNVAIVLRVWSDYGVYATGRAALLLMCFVAYRRFRSSDLPQRSRGLLRVLDAALWGALFFTMARHDGLALIVAISCLVLITASAISFRSDPAMHLVNVACIAPSSAVGLIVGDSELNTELGLFAAAFAVMSILMMAPRCSSLWLLSSKLSGKVADSGPMPASSDLAAPTPSKSTHAESFRLLATLHQGLRRPLQVLLSLAEPGRINLVSAKEYRLKEDSSTLCCEQLLAIIDDAHDVCLFEAGELSLQMTIFNLRELVSEVLVFSNDVSESENSPVKFVNSLPYTFYARWDEARLKRLLKKLLVHAKQRCMQNTVNFEAWQIEAPGTSGVFEFEIEGVTIDRTAGSLSDRPSSGMENQGEDERMFWELELPLLASLARAIGGNINASKNLDRVSYSLRIALPQAQVQGMPRPVPAGISDCHALLSKLQILLAEDHEVNARLLIDQLESHGASVTHVVNGEEAITAALAARRPDVILMDCQMPVLDGFQASRAIREAERVRGWSEVPIIALTALTMMSERKRCIAVGMNAHLVKPFRTDDLARTIWDVVPIARLMKIA